MLGICNGFQILCEAHLLPGALMRNAALHYVCRDQRLAGREHRHRLDHGLRRGPGDRACRSSTARAATSPTAATLDELEAEGRVVVRYVGRQPQRLLNDIAGVRNEAGNVVGPHAAPRARRRGPHRRPSTDGLGFFTSILKKLVNA